MNAIYFMMFNSYVLLLFCQGDRSSIDRAHMIRGRPLQTNSEPQSEVIAGATHATSLSQREPAVLRARLAASRY